MSTIRLSRQPNIINKDKSKGNMGDGWETVDMTPQEIAEWLKQGKPIAVPALKTAQRDEANFVSSQIIGVDFDHGPSVEELAKTPAALKHQLILYSTASSTPENPRSRMLVLLDRPITDPTEYKDAVVFFLSHLSGVDPVCKSAAQVFFGNDKGDFVITQGKPFPAASIIGQKVHKSKVTEATGKAESILLHGSVNGSRHTDLQVLLATYANVLPLPALNVFVQGWYNNLPDKTDFPLDHCLKEAANYAKKSEGVVKATKAAIAQTISDDEIIKRKPAVAMPFTSMAYHHADIKWLIEGILPTETTALMVAPPEHYKTWFAFAMAMSVSTGLPLFGKYAVPTPQKVLLMQVEDSRSIIWQRLSLIWGELLKGYRPPVDPNIGDPDKAWLVNTISPMIDVYYAEDTFQLSSKIHMDELEQMIATKDIKLVIIDPLYAIADSSDFMAKDMRAAIRFKRMRDTYGTTFMILHHSKKADTKAPVVANGKQRRESAWGSQFVNAYPETTMHLRGTKNPKETLFDLHIKSQEGRETRIFSWDISTKEDDSHFRVNEAAAPKISTDSNPLQMFIDHGALTVGQYAEFAGISSSAASRKLMKMASAEIIVRNSDQTYSLPESDQ